MAAGDWRPSDDLTEVELHLRARSEVGESADGSPGPYELADMQAWGADRTVRAAVLRHLLVAEDWPVHERGIQLTGLRIIGHLDLEHATLRYPLQMHGCYLPDGISLTGATVSLLAMHNCRIAGLEGNALLVTRYLSFSDSAFTSPVQLMVADIRGGLVFQGCELESPGDDGVVLFAERIKVDGNLLLASSPSRAFAAAGVLQLPGATIAGNLICTGAQLRRADPAGMSLMAERIKVGGDALLMSLPGTMGFSAKGTINLIGADIAGNLICNGASLGGGDGHDALTAAGITVGGGISLGGGFSAAGAIELRGAKIAANLVCRGGAQINGVNADGNALHAAGINIGQNLQIYAGLTAGSAIHLGNAAITGNMEIKGARLGANSAGISLAAPGLRVGGSMTLSAQCS
jgi:hypothetical protein